MVAILQIIAAYILADLLSGLYHLATDRGFNTRDQIAMFQEHHDTNTMTGFDWQTFAAGMPLVGIGAWFHSVFTVALGAFVALTQVTHYYAHKNSRSKLVHHVVRILQITRVIVPPESHQAHHKPPHSRDFCLLSGWNNWWLNAVISFCEPQPRKEGDSLFRSLIVLGVLALSLAAVPAAEAGLFGTRLGDGIARRVERRQNRRAEGRGLARFAQPFGGGVGGCAACRVP